MGNPRGKNFQQKEKENPQNLAVLRIFLGGDYWTRTSDLLRVKKYGDFGAGICKRPSACAAVVSKAANC